jgi:predicted alpha/beta-hydrolase family hydrolase
MVAVSSGLAQRRITVVRFDFPYMTRSRDEGRRRPPDRAPVLVDACRFMLEQVRTWRRQPRAIVVGGKSMGGRMWSMLLSQEALFGVRGGVYLGYPLHPPGNPAKLRAEHLASVPVPQLFVSGSRDSLARLEHLRRVLEGVPRARLSVVEGGDHSLVVRRRDPLYGSDAWLDRVAAFMHQVCA